MLQTGRAPSAHMALVGDSAIAVAFGDNIDPFIHDRVMLFREMVERLKIDGVVELVPGYCSLTVYYNPLETGASTLMTRLAQVITRHETDSPPSPRVRVIPVRYGEECGPDLETICRSAGISAEEVIHLHTSRVYRVYMLGFLPGFPYMAEVAPAIAVPRLSVPRRSVPAGSVGIAGVQTGIYPVESPGGWRIIGRTPVQIYDPARRHPFLLAAGDRVRFRAIDRRHFDRLCRTQRRT